MNMSDLITRFQNLPNGVRRIVYNYLQHDTAKFINKAIIDNKMKLRYVRYCIIKPQYIDNFLSGETYGWGLISDFALHDCYYGGFIHIIAPHLLELRPSNLKRINYGEGAIQRTNLSTGEIIRLRRKGFWV